MSAKKAQHAEAVKSETVAAVAEDAADTLPIDGPADPRAGLTKLSLALMGCQPELSKIGVPHTGGHEIDQAVVFGELTGLTGAKELPNAKSEDEKYTFGLVGMIEGINIRTGESFQAGVLYLPGGFHDLFLAQMESELASLGKGNVSIKFALKFVSIPAGNPRGYSWKAKNQLPMQKHDPLAQLRARALRDVKLLAGPGSSPALPAA